MSNSPIQKQARHVLRALRRLRTLALRECGLQPENAKDEVFGLTWQAGMRPEELTEAALQQASEIASRRHPLRTGHVYCYACESAACAHAMPPTGSSVFTGYSDNGLARWSELFEFLLQEQDPRTDLLFATPPVTLARLIPRHTLIQNQLSPYGRNSLTYRIWGEVVAGYLPLGNERSAITIQLVETLDHKLHLQLLCSESFATTLADAPNDLRSPLHRTYNAIREARQQVESISHLWQGSRSQKAQKHLRDRAYACLRHLAHSVERKGRQQHRRSAHADRRGQENRPVHKAYDDLQNAALTDLYHDSKRDSYIVLGKSHRIHVFSSVGRHITSLTLGGDELARRTRKNRYQALQSAQANEFRLNAIAHLRPIE